MVVGITTSQILTDIHANCGYMLESAIQGCHTGMNKLLQIMDLRDASQEEVRNQGKFPLIYICNFHVLSNLLLIYICKLHWNNQAIVLVQQLTARNEEMKKIVAFEGLDILFGIIQKEGGPQDAGTGNFLLIYI